MTAVLSHQIPVTSDDLNAYNRLILFEESRHNLQHVCDYFPNAEGVHVSDENTLADSILRNGF
jgi:hypothetical protein